MFEGVGQPTQLTSGEIRRRLVEITQDRLSGRVDRVVEHFAPDAVVYYNCTKDGLFAPGVMHGRGAFFASLKRAEEEYEALDGEIVDILVENENAAMRWRTLWRHRGSGRLWSVESAYLLRWRGGAIVEMHEFLDKPNPKGMPCGALRSLDELITPRDPGLSRDEIVARVEALACYAGRGGPDLNLLRRYYSPDIVCEFIGDRVRIPYAGRRIGIETVINIVSAINIDFEQLGVSLSNIVVDRGCLACRRSVEWRHRGTGRRGIVELGEFLRFEDGLIVELVEYRDSVTILEMQGALEAR
jgi:ketosteroid isomerase-like protein